MKEFKVLRAHDGDRFYDVGAVRKANPADVERLVRMGVLEPLSGTGKAAKPAADKAVKPPQNKGG